MLRRRHLRAASLLVASLGVALAACSTRQLVVKFNSGLLDSNGDPCHDPAQRRREHVRSLIVHELMDGYFTQGSPDGDVAQWLRAAQAEPHEFVRVVAAQAEATHNNLGVVAVRPATAGAGAASAPTDGGATTSAGADRSSAAASAGVDQSGVSASGAAVSATADGGPTAVTARPFVELGRRFRKTASAPICKGDALPTEGAVGPLIDGIRFDAAMQRAGAAVSAVAIEGLVKLDDVQRGASEAFAELAEYVGHRKWRRHLDRNVNAVVIKGGASTGLYSAGVVWVALHLIERCMDDTTVNCGKLAPDPRFSLASGTSTGAMVAVAVDIFNTAEAGPAGAAKRESALSDLAKWFTCYGSSNLYCVRDGDALDMLKNRTGLVEFDGIQSLLTQNVTAAELGNSSELVLNTVDFRTGNLYDLSDQDELKHPGDVVQAAIASAVLPFIAKPVPLLPVNYAPGTVTQVYLDGGIRSELPILPMVRRGAERVLVVSSSASVTDESANLQNGMDIAIRYIDISTGGVTESEIAHAESQVEAVRLAEMDTCTTSAEAKTACGGRQECLDALCSDDWARVCRPDAPKPQGKSRSVYDLTNRRLASVWGTRSFFRDEVETEAVHGYAFDLTQQRRLFLAGAEAARVRCTEIAELLGLPVTDPGTASKLLAWCAPPLASKTALCAGIPSSDALRSCDSTVPPPPPPNELCR